MRRTILALFPTQDQVEDASRVLHQQGIDPSRLRLFSQIGDTRPSSAIASLGTNPEDRHGDASSDLYQFLRETGVPREEALAYTDSVRRGRKLLATVVDSDDTTFLTGLLERLGSIGAESREEFSRIQRHADPGDNSPPFSRINQIPTHEADYEHWKAEHHERFEPANLVRTYENPEPKHRSQGSDKNLNEQ